MEMGEELTIKGTQAKVKVRSPIWVLVWTLLTVGIYFFFWYYFINRELADYGKSKKTEDCGEQPSTSLLAMLLGWIIIVPPFVSIFNCFRRVDAAVQLSRRRISLTGALRLSCARRSHSAFPSVQAPRTHP